MTETWSVGTKLMERTVCGRCGHFHRLIIARKCECCRNDINDQHRHDATPMRPLTTSRCRVCGRRVTRIADGVYVHVVESDRSG